MLRRITFIYMLFLFFGNSLFAQSSSRIDIGKEYLKNSEYKKAMFIFQKEFQNSPNKKNYDYLLICYIGLNDYQAAQKHINRYIKSHKTTLGLYVELGNIFMLQEKIKQGNQEFQNALNLLEENPSQTYSLGNAFYERGYYEWALQTYLLGKELNPKQKYNYRIADIYSQLGDIENMFIQYLDLINYNVNYIQSVKNYLSRSISDDSENKHNKILKSILLKKLQKSPNDIYYSDLLTWLFIQEKSFESAFTHLKALDIKTNGSQTALFELASISKENEAFSTAISCYEYIIKTGNLSPYYLDSRIGLIRVLQEDVLTRNEYKNQEIYTLKNNFEDLINEFGKNNQTILLLKDLAHLHAFYLDDINEGILLLREALTLNANIKDLAACKLELADILLLKGEVWDAILYYAQVERSLKEDPLGQEAKFRKARVYYYQGDFSFSKGQLDVLKSSTTKFIANDAMYLSLLISDNTALDTTTDALLMFAKAELLSFQNLHEFALEKLDQILLYFSDHTIVDDVIFKQAQIKLDQRKYTEAIELLIRVEQDYFFSILADNACFQIAEIYHNKIKDFQKAKVYYEKILLYYKGSIFTEEARKKFRQLRGDEVN